MENNKKVVMFDHVGSNSVLGHSIVEGADKATDITPPHHHKQEKRLFEHSIDAMIAPAALETPEPHSSQAQSDSTAEKKVLGSIIQGTMLEGATLEDRWIPPHGLAPHRLEEAMKDVHAFHTPPINHEPGESPGGWPRAQMKHQHIPFSPQENMRHARDGEDGSF